MRLSTSNSSRTLVVRSLAICAACLALYQSAISAKLIAPSAGITATESNRVRAQRYVYQKPVKNDLVLVGSSITENMHDEYVGENVVNLGQPGSCSQTGLDLVMRSRVKPAVVMVEMDDTISDGADKSFIQALYKQPFYSLCAWVPMLRQEYKPVSVIVDSVKNWKKRTGPTEEERDKNDQIPQELRNQLIAHMVIEQSIPLSPVLRSALVRQAEIIRDSARELKAQSVRVILFRAPRGADVDASVRQTQINTLLHQELPPTEFEWLPDPPPHSWSSNDGMHLIRPDVKVFSAYIRQYLHLRPAKN